MAPDVHETNELSFVRHELGVAWHRGPTEERDAPPLPPTSASVWMWLVNEGDDTVDCTGSPRNLVQDE
jgi:hypothetical protein